MLSDSAEKQRKLTIFLSCSDDGLKQCQQIGKWLVKNGFTVNGEDKLAGMSLFSLAESQVKQARNFSERPHDDFYAAVPTAKNACVFLNGLNISSKKVNEFVKKIPRSRSALNCTHLGFVSTMYSVVGVWQIIPIIEECTRPYERIYNSICGPLPCALCLTV